MVPQTPAEGFKIGLSVCQLFFFPLQRLRRKIFHFAATVFVCACGGHLAGKINDVRVRGESDTEKKMCYFLIINVLLYTVKTWALVKRFNYLACPSAVAEKGGFCSFPEGQRSNK